VTRSSCAAQWLRRGEMALWVVGLSLLGWALAATLVSKHYQARQERAFFVDMKRGPATKPSADPLVLGRIEIPRVGVTAMVREGDDDATLAIAVGHISGTARPGERGNMALAGHRDSFFRGLRDIRRRDAIRIVTPQRSYEYVVDSTEIVGPEATRVLDPTSGTVLTLVTCYPFKYVGHAPNRFIVRASLVAPLPAAVSGGEIPRAGGDLRSSDRTQR
jgi:sortase A